VANAGISAASATYESFSRMSVHEHNLASGRQKEQPEWTVKPELIAQVVARFMEMRARIRKPQTHLTIKNRIRNAERKIKADLPRQREQLVRLCKRHMEASGEAREKLAVLVENLDTQIVVAAKAALLVTGIISYYYLQGWNSVDTARVLHIKPPHVRQVLFRLNRCWQEIRLQQGLALPRAEKPRLALALRRRGMRWDKVAKRIGYSGFHGLRLLLIKEGLYKPSGKHPGWDGGEVINYAKAVRLRKAGLSYQAIADKLGRGVNSVFTALKRGRQGKVAKERVSPRKISDTGEVLRLVIVEGWTHNQVGEKFGVTRDAVSKCLAAWRGRSSDDRTTRLA